jgi:hypothetical protein
VTGLPMKIVAHRDLNLTQARAVTDRIKTKMGDLMADVVRAYQGRVWLALGYKSWPDYIKGEFNHAPLSLPRGERQAVSTLLRGQGMSTRAIGPAIGESHQTVANDLATVKNLTVESEPVPVTGLDGRVRNYSVTCTNPQPPEAAQPAPPLEITVTCPTCGGTGRITK